MRNARRAIFIKDCLEACRDTGLLDGDLGLKNKALLCRTANSNLTWELDRFKKANLLTAPFGQANFERLCLCAEKDLHISHTIEALFDSGLFSKDEMQKNCEDLFRKYEHCEQIEAGIITLKKEGLLDGDVGERNRTTFLNLLQFSDEEAPLGFTIIALSKSGLLTGKYGQANFELLCQNPQTIGSMSMSLMFLGLTQFLQGPEGQTNFEKIIKDKEYEFIYQTLEDLDAQGIRYDDDGDEDIDTFAKKYILPKLIERREKEASNMKPKDPVRRGCWPF
jgi:hypothetical protein